MGHKWCALMFVFVIVFVAVWLSVRAFVYFFKSNRPADTLSNVLIGKDFIPSTMTIDDIAFDDTMLISWDVNSRTPRLFSKWSYKNLKTEKDIAHDFTLG